eukprot:CAMPEP_0172318786 /NCGR_PEP_ID=MMETSP1058-20130122/35789_1 /TAXON_ID=83371 /ORGANISM="Detonula confervacea, Strain CCMP 353" /LENGTH=598 /DNA_ID=CAMNT_0013033687 /DNA_START=101 /DNA_END=1897 /DNA_ORIENTATION=-
MSTSSKLRRPNFTHSSSRGGSTNQNNNSGSATTHSTSLILHSSGQLANYTRQCHKRLSSAARGDNDEGVDHEGVDHNTRINDEGNTNNDTITAATLSNRKSVADTTNKKKKDDPSMEQCITLLEPPLKTFQSNCIKNDSKARAKKKSKKKHRHGDGDNNGNSKDGTNKNNRRKDEDDEHDEEDEVPPQLLRLARFFPFRWLPMKRALLRPPPQHSTRGSGIDSKKSTSKNNDDAPRDVVEVSIHYRLRLAKACWKKGLVAAAEYESLRRSFDFGKRKMDIDGDDGDDDESSKRYQMDKLEGGGDNNNLMERVRLSLMRLPTDAIRPQMSLTAWRHAKEMILECCTTYNCEKKTYSNLQEDGENEDVNKAPNPVVQVADWAMTSWTALLLSQGMDCFTTPIGNNNSVASVENHLANLLSDRSSPSPSNNNSTLALAQAVASRINDLLSPDNLSSLNGVNLYSLGKLLASFHSREDAEMHIVTSIFKCSLVGGMMGLEQLSRLLAVYSCCFIYVASASASTLCGSNAPLSSRRTTVKDLEGRLRAKLDNSEIIKKIIFEKGGDTSTHAEEQQPMPSTSVKAKSFLEAVFCATAHLVKCSK